MGARSIALTEEYIIIGLIALAVAVLISLYYLGVLARQVHQQYPGLELVSARAWLLGNYNGGQVVQVEADVEDEGTGDVTVTGAGIVAPNGNSYYSVFKPVTLSPGEIVQISFNVTVTGGGLSPGDSVFVFVEGDYSQQVGEAVALLAPP